MATMNKVMLCGNLVKKPELKKTQGGVSYVSNSLAINEDYKDKDGKEVKNVVFVDLTLWKTNAENAAKYLDQGSPVLIEGSLQLDRWENDKKEKCQRLSVRVDRMQFLHKAPPRDNAPPPSDDAAPTYNSDAIRF